MYGRLLTFGDGGLGGAGKRGGRAIFGWAGAGGGGKGGLVGLGVSGVMSAIFSNAGTGESVTALVGYGVGFCVVTIIPVSTLRFVGASVPDMKPLRRSGSGVGTKMTRG